MNKAMKRTTLKNGEEISNYPTAYDAMYHVMDIVTSNTRIVFDVVETETEIIITCI